LDVAELGYGPFFHKVAETIREHRADWSVFAEIDPYAAVVGWPFPRNMPERSVNAGHWYDTALLHSKTFDTENSLDVFTGERARTPEQVGRRYVRQLNIGAKAGEGFAGGAPCLVGESAFPSTSTTGRHTKSGSSAAGTMRRFPVMRWRFN
jgi:hypothetical protein